MNAPLAKVLILCKVFLGILLFIPSDMGWDWIPTVSTRDALTSAGLFVLAFILLFDLDFMRVHRRILWFSGWGLGLTLAVLSLQGSLFGADRSLLWRILAAGSSILLIIGLLTPTVLKQVFTRGGK